MFPEEVMSHVSFLNMLATVYVMLLAAVAFTFSGCFCGFEFFSFLTKSQLDIFVRIAIGSVFGIIASAWIGFIANLWLPLSCLHGMIHGLSLLLIGIVLHLCTRRGTVALKLRPSTMIGAVAFPLVFLSLLFHFGFLYHGRITRGACYGDLPFHLNLISSFAFGCNSQRTSMFDVISPFFAGEKLAYPFIPNFYSAMLLSFFDVDYHDSITIPSYVAAFSILALLCSIVKHFTQSEMACVIAPWLFLLSGGFGFLRWFDPKIRNEFYVDYVHNWGGGRHEYWFQVVIHILMPQRASLFSLPFAYAIILLLMQFGAQNEFHGRLFFGIGLLVASLGQVQPHSIMATAQWGVVHLLLRFPWRNIGKSLPIIKNYLILGITAIVLGVPQLFPFMNRLQAESFIKIAPLWTGMTDLSRNFFTMWFYGLGLFFILSMCVGWFFMSRSRILLYLPSVAVFFIANFVWYQPWHMDNTKVFNAGWMPLASAVASLSLLRIGKSVRILGPLVAIALFIGSIASGCLAVYGAALNGYPLWPIRDYPYEFAKFIRMHTEPKSVWITDSWHAHPVTNLAGRQTLAGYGGWLVSHGLSDSERKYAMRRLTANPEDVTWSDRYDVGYVCVRPDSDFSFKPAEDSKSWTKIYGSVSYTVFKRNNRIKH